MPNLRCVYPEQDDDDIDDQAMLDDGEQDQEEGPGSLLRELERRQDDVLAQLDALSARVEAVLVGLGVRLDEPAPIEIVAEE